MRGVGYTVLVCLNTLGVAVAWKLYLGGSENEIAPSVALLNLALTISFAFLLIALSMAAILLEPALRHRWFCLFVAAPAVSLIAAVLDWTYAQGI